MNKRIKIILILLTLSVTLSFMSDTYSRYIASSDGNVQAEFARWQLLVNNPARRVKPPKTKKPNIELSFASWQILVNNKDITDGTTSSLEITPVIEASNNIKDNKIAPSSKGYFDILVNPTEVEMSFDYTVNVKVLNENLPDILISKYAILDKNYEEGKTTITKQDIVDNEIKGSLTYDNKTENFKFEEFTIRVYFEWYEGINESMNDEQDTEVAIDVNKNDTKLQIEATIKFEQKIETTEQ